MVSDTPRARPTQPARLVAAAALLVVFGVLYVIVVQPRRNVAAVIEKRVDAARADVSRRSAIARSGSATVEPLAVAEFDSRTPDGDRAGELADAIEALAGSPAVGGVRGLSIAIDETIDGALDARLALFPRRVASTPVTVSFDARYEQIGRFFWNLRALPTTFELRSLEMSPSGPGLTRATAVLHAFHRRLPASEVRPPAALRAGADAPAPEWAPDPFAPPPAVRPAPAAAPRPLAVRSILISAGRRIALVDGRIVRPGDRLDGAVVRSIDLEFVEIATDEGATRRLPLERPILRMARR